MSEQGTGRSKGGTSRGRIRIPTAVRTIPPEAGATSLATPLGEAAAAVTTATSNTAAGGPTTGAGRLVATATTEQTDPPDPPDLIFGTKCSYSLYLIDY